MPAGPVAPPRLQRLAEAAAWDGALPLAVALVPLAVRVLCPRDFLASVSAGLFVPIAAAVVRSQVAYVQLTRVCRGRQPAGRQLALGLAIALLMASEAAGAVFIMVDDAPREGWTALLAMYGVYLALVLWALRPYNHRPRGGDGPRLLPLGDKRLTPPRRPPWRSP